MPYDFATPGQPMHGYSIGYSLGFQEIRPVALDELNIQLAKFAMNWDSVKFVQANQDMVPTSPGIYFFMVQPKTAGIEKFSILLYIGKTTNLKKRFENYIRERYDESGKAREKIKAMLTIYKNRVEFGFCELGKYEIHEVEDLMIEAFKPCCNTQGTAFKPAFN